MMGQSQESDFFNFYKGGNKYKKPLKYVLFDISAGDTKKEVDNKTYFYMGGETFIFDSKINKLDTYTFDNLKKYKLESPRSLTDSEYLYFKKKIAEFQKETKIKLPIPNSIPLSRNHKYFKIFVLEKTNKNTLLKHEVDWINSTF
ncbi:hypothetical protein DNC80_04145 [Flavobacterium sp. SOK18b]|nr:hypothetical protein [Flavobacterium sp. SOK18b]